MKKLPHLLITFVLLAVVLGGCRRGPGVTESRLIALDSLIGTSPDSALALLQAVDTAALSDADRAYLDLLQTQALYKAYIPATDSTAICRAWRYYADHGPADRRIRALRYRAAAAEDLGDLEEAMRWYKRTEIVARSQGDDLEVGYALMSMGVLYQTNFEWRQAIDKYRQADSILAVNDSECSLYCKLQLSKLYRDVNVGVDSAIYFIESSIHLAEAANDTIYLICALQNKLSKYFYDGDYKKAKQCAVDNITRLGEKAPCECWQLASQSYSGLSMTDSAEYYYTHSPSPLSSFDTSLVYHSYAMICQLNGKMSEAHLYELRSDSIDEVLRFGTEPPVLTKAEDETAEEDLMKKVDKHKLYSILKYVILIVLLMTGLFLVYTYNRRIAMRQELYNLQQLVSSLENQQNESNSHRIKLKKELEEKLSELETLRAQMNSGASCNELEARIERMNVEIGSLRQQQKDLDFIKLLYAQLSASFNNVVMSLGDLAGDYYHIGSNADLFMKRFQRKFDENWNDHDLWNQIEEHINQTHAHALERMLATHSNITQREKKLLMLTILGFSPAAIAVCLKYSNPNVTSVMRKKLEKRLGINCRLEHYLDTFKDLS